MRDFTANLVHKLHDTDRPGPLRVLVHHGHKCEILYRLYLRKVVDFLVKREPNWKPYSDNCLTNLAELGIALAVANRDQRPSFVLVLDFELINVTDCLLGMAVPCDCHVIWKLCNLAPLYDEVPFEAW